MSRKILIVFVLFSIIMASVLPAFVNNKAEARELLVDNNIIETDKEFNIPFEINSMEYYPFIYSSDKSRTWFNDNIIGKGEFKEGYLYIKNLNSGECRLLVKEPVPIFRESDDNIYFICNNGIYSVDYEGKKNSVIYKDGGELSERILERFEDKVYFVEDNNLVMLDVETSERNVLINDFCGDNLCVNSKNEMGYYVGENLYRFNTLTNTIEQMEDNNILLLFYDEVDEKIAKAVPVAKQSDSNLATIRATYPNGSYFTQNAGPCNHHGVVQCSYYGGCNCKQYSYAIQCVGYAKWVAASYSHQTQNNDWNPPASEMYDYDKYFTSDADVKAYYSSCAPGTYVRISKNGTDYGYHSLALVSLSNTGITTYECNLDGHCKVSFNTRTFATYRASNFAPMSSYHRTHSWTSRYASYNSTYHIQYCSKCNGYRLEAHYAPLTGNGVCEACGYAGNIQYTQELNRTLGG